MQTTDQAPGGAMVVRVTDPTAIVEADRERSNAALERLLSLGDVSLLEPEQRVAYYLDLCQSLGLNARSRPFTWMYVYNDETKKKDKLVLYPNESCAAQIRANHHISARITKKAEARGLAFFTAVARTPSGREIEATKIVPIAGLTGLQLANALMKAETGAYRRATLALIGMAGAPDIDELRNARPAIVDGTGRVLENPTDEQRALAEDPRLARVIGEPTYETTASASESPLAGGVSQAPTIDELEPPSGRPPRPRQTFKCDKPYWSAQWGIAVRGSRFANPDDRHEFVAWYTSGWPEDRQTNSLGTFLNHATDRQAHDLIETVKRVRAEEEEAAEADPDGDLDGIDGLTADQAMTEAVGQAGYEARPALDERGAASALLTGAAPPTITAPAAEVERPDPDGTYTRRELVNQYLAAVKRMKALDRTFRPVDIDRQADDELLTWTLRTHAEADAIEEAIRAAADPDDESPEQLPAS